MSVPQTAEHRRLAEAAAGGWRDWGPYLAERAWGTVREDYSADGDAWNFFPHDHARSRTYRWNEDGMAGFCDAGQSWCLGLALWNGADPILKERMFGLSGPEGNHGEDAKEYWWYLDGTPTHSFQRWRYHYPQRAFPYEELVDENARRSKDEPEYELVDTGIFDDGRYWAVTVDYAKAGPHDLLMTITVENAGPEAATIHLLPTLWLRNTWSWGGDPAPKPVIRSSRPGSAALHRADGDDLVIESDGDDAVLLCENETNVGRLFGEMGGTAYPKDGINDHVVGGLPTVNPAGEGTKAALHRVLTVAPGARATMRIRLRVADAGASHPFADDGDAGFDRMVAERAREADEFYAAVLPPATTTTEAVVARQAFAGLTWSKQFYHFDVRRWLAGDPVSPPPPPERRGIRNGDWRHLAGHDVILMPDPWEYPWFAAWDLAFHCVTLAHIDPEFAKQQLVLILREWYMHPNGQLPAYEWDFGDANPPIEAWAALRVFEIDGGRDFTFLGRVFHKLLMNFTWWTNNKDHGDNNLFEGGFMGLDNIAPLDRSTLPPEVGVLEQADSTAWMATYALHLLSMALLLTSHDPAYEDVATKFFEHFLVIADSANDAGLWDEEDAFYYDVLHLADGRSVPMKVRSLVGLIPVTAALVFDRARMGRLDEFVHRGQVFLERNPGFSRLVHIRGDEEGGFRSLLALVEPERLERVLHQALDPATMLSPYGIRSISAWHREHPFRVEVDGVEAVVDYEPGESTSGLFGGNSNWRGPVWFPLNVMIIESLRGYDVSLGEEHRIEYPAGSGQTHTLGQVADDLSSRLLSLFVGDPSAPGGGPRPSDARYPLLSTDPRWRDGILFYEYFHGDTGQGLGASHQTGWTALVAHVVMTRKTRPQPLLAADGGPRHPASGSFPGPVADPAASPGR
ncbi:glucosidase [Herbiconiux sp. CPCC 203407]|uniref:Glucosidase n=1 Tax=Herbiconiux oxytropis TaxID=2970915 RepID=A0AA41XDQ2_9MICO|nr:glucosidase [Herbiconiux oxytropis]MCS5721264.1 glucosidase [Herbiconiux oxytropis]MCS5726297.1 glucosidase [Herbiconiux oxytropis]